ncbi:MAG: hypothetical protein AAF547_22540, partial [Actinomycetota bacterium]
MSPAALARLVVVGFTVAAVQAHLIDSAGGSPLRHLDLPLMLVVVLALVRPGGALMTGFVIGLAVDAFHGRLFGLHGLAYAVLAPVATLIPVGALRSRVEAVAVQVVAVVVVAETIVIGGAAVAAGRMPPDLVSGVVPAAAMAVLVTVPLVLALQGRGGVAGPDRVGPAPSSVLTRDPIVPVARRRTRSTR